MGIRTPDLLHAIQWQPVHSSPSPQVTVPQSAPESACVQACCGTFLLYDPMPPPPRAEHPDQHRVSQRRVVPGPAP